MYSLRHVVCFSVVAGKGRQVAEQGGGREGRQKEVRLGGSPPSLLLPPVAEKAPRVFREDAMEAVWQGAALGG